jgi:AraC-like DNA-binding protein
MQDLEVVLVQFQNKVEEKFKTEHGLEYYADQLGISPRALTMRTTRHLKKSGREVIFDRLLLEAKRMLAYTEHSISNIGYELGFDDANHFSRFFKMQSGQTAQVFRQQNRKRS